jgi:hypothetical protein
MGNHRDHLSRYGTFRRPVILSSQRLRQIRQSSRQIRQGGAKAYADGMMIVPRQRLQWFPDY